MTQPQSKDRIPTAKGKMGALSATTFSASEALLTQCKAEEEGFLLGGIISTSSSGHKQWSIWFPTLPVQSWLVGLPQSSPDPAPWPSCPAPLPCGPKPSLESPHWSPAERQHRKQDLSCHHTQTAEVVCPHISFMICMMGITTEVHRGKALSYL